MESATYTVEFTPEWKFLIESNAIEGVYDMDSFNQAAHAWNYLEKQDKLSIGVILRTHKILSVHSNLLPNQKGYFRYIDVQVGGHLGAAPHMIRPLMDDWIEEANFFNDPESDHIKFEKIHPFVDFNGRIGRMLWNWKLVKMGEPIKIFYEKDKQEYYKLFK